VEERELVTAMRLLALEHVMAVLLATECSQADDPFGSYELIRRNFLDAARKETFPGVDATVSDLVASEFEAAMDRLLRMTKERLEYQPGRR
jgi:hypothetical protein